MTRKCSVYAKKGVMSGNNVSHSNRRTRRRFLPNIQTFSLASEILGTVVTLRATTYGIRTIEHNHGLDNYLLSVANSKLTAQTRVLKRRIVKALAKRNSTENLSVLASEKS